MENMDYIHKKYDDLIGRKTGSEKVLMGFSMFAFSSMFLLSSLDRYLTPGEIRKQVFLRLYGNDISESTREDIIKNF
ncbi:MAG: hypothetical protein JW770_05975 [Actinobacteria bacterium]|nr:hypothetical protein [Actinomycetota bacterium]